MAPNSVSDHSAINMGTQQTSLQTKKEDYIISTISWCYIYFGINQCNFLLMYSSMLEK